MPEIAILIRKLLLIALAGAVGALARYWLALLVQQYSGARFPWGTTVVNLLGCFAFGLCWSWFEARTGTSEARVVVLTGFMGAFTTFSTFVFETAQLMRDEQWMLAMGNVAFQNVVGIVALFLGLALGRLL